MAIYLEILTVDRVKNILPHLLKINSFKLDHEIDSTHYGEGFQLRFKSVELRLYDEERSDLVMMDKQFKSGSLTWNEAFKKNYRIIP